MLFPGLDPYLEAQLWADFHTDLMVSLRALLMPQLRPRYTATVEERIYVEHSPDTPWRAIVPDITVSRRSPSTSAGRRPAPLLQAPLEIPLAMPEQVRERYLEIRHRENRRVVTVLELLSPANKRPGSEGRRQYLAKRDIVLQSDSHLLELDFLRGGERLPMARPLPTADYYVIVSRSNRRPLGEVWALMLVDHLPTIPVPLSDGDPDVPLDLQKALKVTCERADYAEILDYTRPVDPPLDRRATAWTRRILAARRQT